MSSFSENQSLYTKKRQHKKFTQKVNILVEIFFVHYLFLVDDTLLTRNFIQELLKNLDSQPHLEHASRDFFASNF